MGPVTRGFIFGAAWPTVIMMAGLQGAGKTTTCGKLAKIPGEQGASPHSCGGGPTAPGRRRQLRVVGETVGVPVYTIRPRSRARAGGKGGCGGRLPRRDCAGEAAGRDVVILDTAGRLHIDDELWGNSRKSTRKSAPIRFTWCSTHERAGRSEQRKAFNDQLELDGLILTKFDSDTRGGALLSARCHRQAGKIPGCRREIRALEASPPEGFSSGILADTQNFTGLR